MSANELKKSAVLSFLNFLFFFVVLSVTNPKPPRMMSLSANDRPFVSSFRHIPPQESFVQLANLTIQTKKWPPGRKAYLVKLGLNSFVDGRQDICKDKESNLGSVVGY